MAKLNGAGTITLTNGSATISGLGTAFTAFFQGGDVLWVPDASNSAVPEYLFEIESVASDTSMAVTSTFGGSTVSGRSYRRFRQVDTQQLASIFYINTLDALRQALISAVELAGATKRLTLSRTADTDNAEIILGSAGQLAARVRLEQTSGRDLQFQVSENGSTWTTVFFLDRATSNFVMAPSQQLLAHDGSATAPGVAFSGDTNTGFGRIGADNPGVATNGVWRAGWSADGHYLPFASNAHDIGSASLPIRNVYADVVNLNGKIISGQAVTIADDAVATITPPRPGGKVSIATGENTSFPSHFWSADIFYDTGGSLAIFKTSSEIGASLDVVTINLTGTTGTNGNLTVSAQTGEIQIENRTGAAREVTMSYT